MRQQIFILLISLAFLANFSGCSAFKKHILHHEQEVVVHNRVLVYDRPYDYTFLKTIEALNTFPEWVLEETDKNKGLIVIRNTQYGHLFDRDKWVARFSIRRLDKRKTAVSLEPDSQRLEKGGELLDRIDEVVNISSNIEGLKDSGTAVTDTD
jgi:hypothetical protein